MGAETGISWTDKTANFLVGCSRVSEGCRHCYAEQMAATKFKRFLGGPVWGAGNPRYETSAELWKQPLRWARQARKTGQRVRVFGNSLYDICENHPTVNAIRPRIWDLVDQTRDVLTWQFCTKRPERIADCLPETWGEFWSGVWLGTTVESDQHADRIGHLQAVPWAGRARHRPRWHRLGAVGRRIGQGLAAGRSPVGEGSARRVPRLGDGVLLQAVGRSPERNG